MLAGSRLWRIRGNLPNESIRCNLRVEHAAGLHPDERVTMTTVEKEYARHIRSLSGAERVRVAAAMYENLRSAYELQIRRAGPDLTGTSLRIAVARRMYRHDPRTLALLRSLGPEP
jgi:hypothetical protein